MEELESKSNGFQLAIDILRRRKWLGIVTALLAGAAGVSVVTFLPEVYKANATVLIERQQIPDELVRPTVTSPLEVRLHTISQQILSRSRLESLIDRFGLYKELRREGKATEEIIAQMRSDIGLELRGGERRRGDTATVAFNITYQGREPQQVAMVTNVLASFYIEENLKAREQQAVGTAQFLRVQLEEMQRNLETQEKKLSTFKDQHIGELPHQQEANLATLEQLNSRLRLNNDNQVQVGERKRALEAQLSEAMGMAADGPDFPALKLMKMKAELAALERQYTDQYPDVIRLRREIEKLEQQLAEPSQDNPSTQTETLLAASPYVRQLKQSIRSVDAELAALKLEAERLQRTIAEYQDRVDNAPRREQEYQILARDYETTKELYRSLLLRQKEAELAENMEQRQKGEQFRILDPATIPEMPAAPNRLRLNLMALALALGLAGGVVLLAEQLDTSLHSPDDLRALTSAPILASIPRIETARDRWRKRTRMALGVVTTGLGLVAIVAVSYLVATENSQLTSLLLR